MLAAAPQVLVSEWVEGRPLAAVIAEGTEAERDHAGLLYQRFLLSSPQRAGAAARRSAPRELPHDGGRPHGGPGLRAVAHLPDGMPPAVGRLMRIALSGDAQTVLEGLTAERFVRPHITLDADRARYLTPFIEPVEQPQFHYSREWLRGLFTRVKDPKGADFTVGLKLNLPVSHALIHRVWMEPRA